MGRVAVFACLGLSLGVILFVISLAARERYGAWWIGPALFPWTSLTAVLPMLAEPGSVSEATGMLIWFMGPLEYAAYGAIYVIMRLFVRRRAVVAVLAAVHAAAAGTVLILLG